MTYIFDYTLKFILLFFIFARLISGAAAQPPTAEPMNEPRSDSTT